MYCYSNENERMSNIFHAFQSVLSICHEILRFFDWKHFFSRDIRSTCIPSLSCENTIFFHDNFFVDFFFPFFAFCYPKKTRNHSKKGKVGNEGFLKNFSWNSLNSHILVNKFTLVLIVLEQFRLLFFLVDFNRI